jgi:hypothetical protein
MRRRAVFQKTASFPPHSAAGKKCGWCRSNEIVQRQIIGVAQRQASHGSQRKKCSLPKRRTEPGLGIARKSSSTPHPVLIPRTPCAKSSVRTDDAYEAQTIEQITRVRHSPGSVGESPGRVEAGLQAMHRKSCLRQGTRYPFVPKDSGSAQ